MARRKLAAVSPPGTPVPPERRTPHIEVRYAGGEAYIADIRGHRLWVDQLADDGGSDAGPAPIELFVASLATCVAHAAGRFLSWHGLGRAGMRVWVEFAMTGNHPDRVAAINLRLTVPKLPVELTPQLRDAVTRCTVCTLLRHPPLVDIEIDGRPRLAPD